MPSLDTNVIFRFLLNDVPAKTDFVEKLITNSDNLTIEDGALFELVWVMSGVYYNLPREIIARSLLKLAAISKLQINRQLLYHVLPIYVKHGKVSFIDVWLAESAKLNKTTPLLTFDKALAKTMPQAQLLKAD